jgi:enoyl-CoA hydratase
MSDSFIVSRDGDVTTITTNKADDGNRFSDAMAIEMAEMLDKESKSARLVVFKGAGKDFCTGRAAPPGALGSPGPRPVGEAYDFRTGFEAVFNCYDSFRRCRAPILGVIQGKALGFGCSLSSLCDITIAADSASFALPETAHGIMPTAAMSALMDRVQRKQLMYIAYSAKEIAAEQAMMAGIVSIVVPAAQLDATVQDMVGRIKKIPKPAVLAVKEFVMNGMGLPNASMLAFAQNLHATVNSYSGMRT